MGRAAGHEQGRADQVWLVVYQLAVRLSGRWGGSIRVPGTRLQVCCNQPYRWGGAESTWAVGVRSLRAVSCSGGKFTPTSRVQVV